ncbi:glycosyltransferase [Cytobacillus sp. Sa5YUA1]|uniref:Glycosyltransferase n=1 Tax=Cytobacillus stercorigallinarum TaxID=2762240 RepID=A0ABR8QM41_9BACI|nr:glycosyltransferase [Cytobacillus stercorigallinarum]
MIARDVGGKPEMIEDGVTGFLIPSGDSKKLAQQISFLLREDKIRKSLGYERICVRS